MLMGELSNQAARQRTQDIHDVIAKPECAGIKIVEEQTGNWDRTQGTDLMTNWISSGVQFDARGVEQRRDGDRRHPGA